VQVPLLILGEQRDASPGGVSPISYSVGSFLVVAARHLADPVGRVARHRGDSCGG
jgi:hypothetical protein